MERRRIKRNEFTQCLDFKMSTFTSSTVLCKGQGMDISSHGLCIMTDYHLDKGMVLRVVLPEYRAGVNIPVFAEVAWIQSTANHVKAGLRFM